MKKRIGTFLAVLAILSGTTFTGVVLAANPSADLDQCANGAGPSPSTDGCAGPANDWVNGNLGASKSVYFEDDSIPYRMRFGNLGTGSSNTVTIEWDTTKAGKHAIDYIDDFNESVLDANPCIGVANCNAGTFTSFSIPADPQVTGASVTPKAGAFRMYGGTITGVSPYSYANGTGFAGDKSARITITFSASRANPVLAWGGHIAARRDWSATGAAVAIPGSPYHTRLINLNGSGGNQDRSLSAAAVIFPASLKVIKEATPEGSTSFGFTATPNPPLSNFSLVDNGTDPNFKLFSMITDFQKYTITESTPPSGWGFDSAGCTVDVSNGGSRTITGAVAEVTIAEGENWTCTYTNSLRTGTLKVIKHVVNDNGGSATASQWPIHVKSGSTDVTGSPQDGSETGTTYTLSGGTYTVSEGTGPDGYSFDGFTGDCSSTGSVTVVAGQQKTCTLTNNDQQATITVVKRVDNSNGGTAEPDDFKLTLEGDAVLSGVANNVNPGTYTAAETNLPGYTFGGFSGDCDANGDTTVALGEHKTCYLDNGSQQTYITIVKVVNNDHGGTAAPDDFLLTLDGTATTSGTKIAVDPGTYTAGETQLNGYTFDGFSGDCDSTGSITVALGDDKTCTLTNSDEQAYITVVKVVNNDHGGSAAPDDFLLTLEGGATTSGTAVPVDPGTYTAAETQLDGYTFDGFSGDCDSNGDTTVALGESKTCTLTNTDKQAYITVVKVVNNTHGLSAAPDDFLLTLEGDATTSGTAVPVDPGTYTAGEKDLTGTGYTFDGFTGDCDSNGDTTVALGESKTCTLTNSDTPETPDISTDVDVQIRDNVTVSGRGTPTGKVDFRLYTDSCDPLNLVAEDLGVDLSGGTAQSKWVDVTASGDYFWQIHYSGDQNNAEHTGSCDEETSISSSSFNAADAAGFAFGIPMLAWMAWKRRRRDEEDNLA